MIYITGDLHGGNELIRFKSSHVVFTEKDVIIQAGDAGIIFYNKESNKYGEENKWLNWYEKNIHCPLVVVLGNHENYHRIYNEFPLVKIYGGAEAFQVRNNIFILKDVQILNIDGTRILTIRGAESIDKKQRIEDFDWWRNEELSYSEMQLSYNKIMENIDYDYVVTHTAPFDIINKLEGFHMKPDRTSQFLNQIYKVIKYKRWYFGHFHKDVNIKNTRFTCLYQTIERIE